MKRSIISAVAVTAIALALSACGAGRNAQTAEMVAPVAGVSSTLPGKDGVGTVSLRNAALVYPGPQGYKADSEATANVWLFNSTPDEQVVVARYSGQEIKRFTIKPGSYERAELKFKLTQPVGNDGWAQVDFEWPALNRTMQPQLPIAPPLNQQPGEKIELPAEPGAESH